MRPTSYPCIDHPLRAQGAGCSQPSHQLGPRRALASNPGVSLRIYSPPCVDARAQSMRLLVFLHGTTLMHASAAGRSREERIAQVREGTDTSLRNYGEYVPVGRAVEKLWGWEELGAHIEYLTSHRNPDDVAQDVAVLRRHGFPPGRVLARGPRQSYGDVVAREMPDLLIEDDCASIGTDEIAYSQVEPDLRSQVRSVIVPEFGGIDHLPDSLLELTSKAWRRTSPKSE